ncbi:hypothetical protein LAWI1_G007525 [Lachnellula willkommii]|uniref:Aminoglycoside phosphotransferase domain-containing protein n=1 Tax=Lachnellula willkommii TaxID=215461 RepID=A0A559M7G3_9HELO|nr:hypothetical protein LAWI1_G007525 [Lachnellula willkommii]
MEGDYNHPEKIYKDLIYKPTGQYPPFLQRLPAGPESMKLLDETLDKPKGSPPRGLNHIWGSELPDGSYPELCWSCGWNVYHQGLSSYGSRIRIFHTRGNMGLWELGSQLMIRDEPNDHRQGNEHEMQLFLRKQPNLAIPLPKRYLRVSEPTDPIHFTIISRAPGVRLDTIWDTLSLELKTGYKNQLADAIKQLRQFTAPVAQKVDGSPLDDILIASCWTKRPPTCKKIGRTADEWLEGIADELRVGLSMIHKTKDPVLVETKYQELKANFPKGEPYTLTHADFNFSNIIVKDDKIEAIIDWEMAGYYPWWVERWRSLIGGNYQSNEIIDSLWADIGFEMDEATFQHEVIMNVAPVLQAWEQSMQHTNHPGYQSGWERPPFCECHNWTGIIQCRELGDPIEHIFNKPDTLPGEDTALPYLEELRNRQREGKKGAPGETYE